MTPAMTVSTALYLCEDCDDAGNEGNCYHADQLRHAPTHQWLCKTCYEDAKAEDDGGEDWPAWDELIRHPCMASELIEARIAIAHMHDMIAIGERCRVALLKITEALKDSGDPLLAWQRVAAAMKATP